MWACTCVRERERESEEGFQKKKWWLVHFFPFMSNLLSSPARVPMGCALYKSWVILHLQELAHLSFFLVLEPARFTPGLLGCPRLVPVNFWN